MREKHKRNKFSSSKQQQGLKKFLRARVLAPKTPIPREVNHSRSDQIFRYLLHKWYWKGIPMNWKSEGIWFGEKNEETNKLEGERNWPRKRRWSAKSWYSCDWGMAGVTIINTTKHTIATSHAYMVVLFISWSEFLKSSAPRRLLRRFSFSSAIAFPVETLEIPSAGPNWAVFTWATAHQLIQ